jgi:16S rRNA (adenine1518-N6/adenine1519-N6)-dimethyltransferase
MSIFKPKELLKFLEEIGASPKKGLSQNFLIDGNILKKIVQASGVQPGEVVVEIGPGPGALTEQLLEAGAIVIAVEKDRKLAEALTRFGPNRLTVHCADVLEFDLPVDRPVKVIGNLPYQITTPILAKFLPQRDKVESLTVMVQEEVARRMVAGPGSKTYGHLSLFLKFFSEPKYNFSVGRNCFYPPPKVDSAIVTLTLSETLPDVDEEPFWKMTRTAFQTRRKMLRRGLRDLYPSADVEAALKDLGLSVQSRPEDLSLDSFLGLFERLQHSI